MQRCIQCSGAFGERSTGHAAHARRVPRERVQRAHGHVVEDAEAARGGPFEQAALARVVPRGPHHAERVARAAAHHAVYRVRDRAGRAQQLAQPGRARRPVEVLGGGGSGHASVLATECADP